MYQYSPYREGYQKTEKGIKNVFKEVIAKNSPNLRKETENQVKEAQRIPNKMNPNRPAPRATILKMAEVKGKQQILKAAKEKQTL